RYFDANVWRIDLEGSPAPRRLIASNLHDSGAQYSPDGSRIAFRSNRGGNDEVWVSDSEGGSTVRLSSFGGPTTGSPQRAPDGRTTLGDSRPSASADIFSAGADGANLRRITDAPSDEVLPRFSRDGKPFYFASNRGGAWQIWKQPLAGGPARQITRHGGF